MPEVQKGKAVVWGVEGITITAGIVSATTEAALQSGQLERSSTKVDIQNGDGDTIAQVFYDFKKRLSITAVPYHDTTQAGASTSVDAWNPKPGTKMTIVDADTGNVDDNYNLLSSRMSRTNTGAASVDLEMEAADDNTIELATDPLV